MPRSRKAVLNQAVEERTRQRLAARKEAAQRAAETKRRKREELTQTAPKPEVTPQIAERQTERPEAKEAEQKAISDRGPIHGERSRTMATVALRGESANRLRTLAAGHKLSLAKLLVRMMDSLEAEAQ